MLLDPYITGDVAKLIVVLVALAPRRAYRGVLGIGSMQQRRDDLLALEAAQPLEVGVGED